MSAAADAGSTRSVVAKNDDIPGRTGMGLSFFLFCSSRKYACLYMYACMYGCISVCDEIRVNQSLDRQFICGTPAVAVR